MIKLLVIGHLGRDCVVKDINGKSMMSFTVANTEKFKDQQGVQKEKTTWVDCAWWSDRTAVAPYLKKGTQVFVEGTPDVETYQNKEGQTVATLRLRVSQVQLLGGGNRESNQNGSLSENSGSTTTGQLATAEVAEGSDDLPF